ncbi:unnamed protein product [Paramecium sonneborni]|uniref:Uncharacterized protein n=1 Tax=Paramecium sonneborni TaxID=65129 RepID=A0A8S1R7B7_9CILI|nr:unnamed protein product [Paramecium sonneborni]
MSNEIILERERELLPEIEKEIIEQVKQELQIQYQIKFQEEIDSLTQFNEQQLRTELEKQIRIDYEDQKEHLATDVIREFDDSLQRGLFEQQLRFKIQEELKEQICKIEIIEKTQPIIKRSRKQILRYYEITSKINIRSYSNNQNQPYKIKQLKKNCETNKKILITQTMINKFTCSFQNRIQFKIKIQLQFIKINKTQRKNHKNNKFKLTQKNINFKIFKKLNKMKKIIQKAKRIQKRNKVHNNKINQIEVLSNRKEIWKHQNLNTQNKKIIKDKLIGQIQLLKNMIKLPFYELQQSFKENDLDIIQIVFYQKYLKQFQE